MACQVLHRIKHAIRRFIIKIMEDTPDKCCATCFWNISSDMAQIIQEENHYTDEETEAMEGCSLHINHHNQYVCDNWLPENE